MWLRCNWNTKHRLRVLRIAPEKYLDWLAETYDLGHSEAFHTAYQDANQAYCTATQNEVDARALAMQPKYDAHQKGIDEARRAYHTIVAPARVIYLEAQTKAFDMYAHAPVPSDEDYRNACDAAQTVFNRTVQKAQSAYLTAKQLLESALEDANDKATAFYKLSTQPARKEHDAAIQRYEQSRIAYLRSESMARDLIAIWEERDRANDPGK
jgi:hypothetical protein